MSIASWLMAGLMTFVLLGPILMVAVLVTGFSRQARAAGRARARAAQSSAPTVRQPTRKPHLELPAELPLKAPAEQPALLRAV
jgi:hypothetical protein